jgi:RNA polymerase sigma-70 factor (ECF subfamily)
VARIRTAPAAVADNVEASRVPPPLPERSALPNLTPFPRKRKAERVFEQLYAKHAREVYQYALAVLTNPDDAEDVTQTTFLNAFRALEQGAHPHRPHNWLIAIAHNVCRMRWRQASHRPREVALDAVPEPVAPDDDDRPDLDQVLHALAQLSFNQRAALVMRELEGRSYKEIAGVLGLSVGAVEALLFRARRRLKLQRQALGVLSTAPLPTSISSVLGLGGGGGAVVAGGSAAAIGDIALKAVAVVALGTVAAGAGYKAVDVVRATQGRQQPVAAENAKRAAVAPSASRQTRQATTSLRAQPLAKRKNEATTAAQPPATGPTLTTSPVPTASPTTATSAATNLVTTTSLPVQPPPLPTLATPPLPPPPALPPPPPLPVTTPSTPTITLPKLK